MIQQKLRERMINFLRHTVNCEVTAHENLSLAVRAAEISSCLEDLDPRRDLSLARPRHTFIGSKVDDKHTPGIHICTCDWARPPPPEQRVGPPP